MQKLAHAAYAAALVSVMAISVGPANAQQSADDFYDLACIDSAGLCYTRDGDVDPIDVDGDRFVNSYRPYADADRYVNAYRPGGVYVPYSSPLAPGLFGLALDSAWRTTRTTTRTGTLTRR